MTLHPLVGDVEWAHGERATAEERDVPPAAAPRLAGELHTAQAAANDEQSSTMSGALGGRVRGRGTSRAPPRPHRCEMPRTVHSASQRSTRRQQEQKKSAHQPEEGQQRGGEGARDEGVHAHVHVHVPRGRRVRRWLHSGRWMFRSELRCVHNAAWRGVDGGPRPRQTRCKAVANLSKTRLARIRVSSRSALRWVSLAWD